MEPTLPPIESIPQPLPNAPRVGFKKSILVQILAVLQLLVFLGYFGPFLLNITNVNLGGFLSSGYIFLPAILHLGFLWASITVLFTKNEHRYKIARTILIVGFFLGIIFIGLLAFALGALFRG